MFLAFLFAPPSSDDTLHPAARHAEREGRALGTDPALVARIRAGDEMAFTHVVTSLAAPLLAYVTSFVRSPELAKDLVQDVFADLWTHREQCAPTGSLERHLFGAARFRALHALRRQRVEQRHTLGAEKGEVSVFPDDERLEHAELYAAVVRAAQTLPPRAAVAFTLRWRDGLSYAAIADRLGISVKGVEIQITRALKAIRDRLGRLDPP